MFMGCYYPKIARRSDMSVLEILGTFLPTLKFLGIIIAIVVGFLFPRVAASLLAGILLGGNWWWLFRTTAAIGLVFDILTLSETEIT
jgi:hypothetical protein